MQDEDDDMRNLFMESRSFDPYFNLALEQCLYESLQPGDAALYLWQNQNTVVIGRNQNAWRECKCELLESEGGHLARRNSGGGAVFHDLGNLNFTFAASEERYDLARQLGVIKGALAELGIEAVASGRNDITLADGRKFSGNAFQHGRGRSLQHGTLLMSVDMAKLSRYLNPSKLKLAAKGVESVRARVCNLSELAPGLTPDAMRPLLQAAFAREYGECEVITPADFAGQALDGVREHLASWEWRFGQTPRFDVTLETRFAWGEVELALGLKAGRVERCALHTDSMDEYLSERVEGALTGKPFGKELAQALYALADAGVSAEIAGDLRRWLAQELD